MAFTYFFRDVYTLDLIIRYVLPKLRSQRYINIWDAGCAHGPEAYSIAILLRENMTGMLFRNVRIYATDIDRSDRFGQIVTEGLYSEQDIRRVPVAFRHKYFTETDRAGWYRLTDEIRCRVSFVKHDLLSLEPVRVGFSLVVCKNVLLHFTARQRLDVMRMFYDSLRDGGFFVMERTQQMPALLDDMFRRVTGEGQIFQKVMPNVYSRSERGKMVQHVQV